MRWSELLPSGPGAPPALALRELILGALAWNAVYLRTEIGFCADCTRAIDGLCQDHRDDSAHADDLEAAYGRVRTAAGDWDALVLTLAGQVTS